MGTRRVMRLLDPMTGRMECKVCGAEHLASLAGGGHYKRGSWQCRYGCRLEDTDKRTRGAAAERR